MERQERGAVKHLWPEADVSQEADRDITDQTRGHGQLPDKKALPGGWVEAHPHGGGKGGESLFSEVIESPKVKSAL